MSRPCIGNYCPRDTWQDKCIYIYLFSEKTSQTWHFCLFLSFKIHQLSGLKPLAGRLCPAGHMFDTPAIDHTCQTQGPWPEFGPFSHFKWPTKQFFQPIVIIVSNPAPCRAGWGPLFFFYFFSLSKRVVLSVTDCSSKVRRKSWVVRNSGLRVLAFVALKLWDRPLWERQRHLMLSYMNALRLSVSI